MPTYDPTQADGGFDLIPAGTYRCQFSNVTDKDKEGNRLMAKSGHEMFNLRLTVIDGDHEGAIVFDRIVFGGKGFSRVKILLGALGFATDKPINVTTAMLQDQVVDVDIIQEPYDGKMQNKVRFDGYHAVEASSF